MTIIRAEFAEEDRRLKILARQGWAKDGPSNRNLKSWLRGWRQFSPTIKRGVSNGSNG